MPPLPQSLLLAILVVLLPTTRCSAATTADHRKLFPDTDEYDSKILDPTTIYGSPFGGFSRATRSRLAALPLRLPDIVALEDANDSGDAADQQQEVYFETSDGIGRGYICRVYHEDSLDAFSINDSMFDAPVLSKREKSTRERELLLEKQEETEDDEDLDDDGLYLADDEEDEEVEKQHSDDILLMETSRRLSRLEGVCSQIHLGWWSYEWCYDQSVTQFHIHVDASSTGLELRDVTSLGKFKKRKYNIDLSVENPDLSPIVNKYAEDEPELSRVIDTYSDGDTCDETGKPRTTTVQYFCCSERLMEKYKGPVLRHGNPLTSKIVSIVNLSEDHEELCTYTITVCTPLLCEEVKSDDDDGLLFDVNTESLLPSAGSSKGSSKSSRSSSNKKGKKGSSTTSSSSNKGSKFSAVRENETIRDVLDRVIGKACIQSSTSGWWSYEYCHHKHVRQFHESIQINVDTGMASSGTEDVYMLGFYDQELDRYPDHEEHKHVFNTTLSPAGGGGGSPGAADLNAAEGKDGALTVAAYFSAEYTGGDVCDDSDVTDSAVKAGGVSSRVIERASSVRYSCGPTFDIYVKEDHTCHYIVEVTVPALCDHSMFKAPVAKKRMVKCIPVEDASKWEETDDYSNDNKAEKA